MQLGLRIRDWSKYHRSTTVPQESKPISEPLFIRKVDARDAETAAQLCEELGYPVSIEAIKKRIANLERLPDHVVYVGTVSEMVVGWIDVGIVHHLQSEPYGEIGGFVVSNAYRSQGVGQRLLAQAEQWVANRRITQMVVRSRITREPAHRFYLREGYSHTKTSAVFSKKLK